jgi:hypothetical protein
MKGVADDRREHRQRLPIDKINDGDCEQERENPPAHLTHERRKSP